MTVVTPLANNFAAGEIAPLLRRRIDYQRNQTALAICQGYMPLREGGVTRMPGTIFDGYTYANAACRLIAFQFAADDAVILEFTANRMRVWRYGALVMDGASPYEQATPYDAPSLPLLQWAQSADVIYFLDGGIHPMQKLTRFALDNWTIEAVQTTNGPFRVQNLDESLTMGASAATGTVTLTASADFFTVDHIDTLMLIEPADITAVPLWTSNTAVTVGDLMRNDGNTYVLTVGTDTKNSPPVHQHGTQRVQTAPDVTWRFIDDGRGVVKITAVASPTSATATVVRRLPKDCVVNPSYRFAEAAWSPQYGYPATLTIFEQHLVAGATLTEPRTLWFSTLGDYVDFEPSVDADGSFAYTLDGQNSLNGVVNLARGRSGLHALGLRENHSTRSTAAQQVIGPTTTAFRFDGDAGSNGTIPINSAGGPVFVSRDGRRLFTVVYSLEQDANREVELSITARHIGNLMFKELAAQSAPDELIWLRLGTGDLALLIYDPSQDILGWARLSAAGGTVENIAVTTDATGTRDELTLCIRRTLNGQTVRCIERLAPIFALQPETTPLWEAHHAYCATTFTPGAPTDSFDVPHLEGEQVHAWTEKGSYGPLTAGAGGTVTLPDVVSHAIIGLFDNSHMAETLDLQAAAPEGSAMGRRKRAHANSVLGLHRTAQGRVAVVERDINQPPRVGPPILIVPRSVGSSLDEEQNGLARVPVPSGMASEIAFRFLPEGLAPMTITAVLPTIEEGGR